MANWKRTHNSTPNVFRKLDKTELGGVIFGCTDKTLHECLSKQLFGLPQHHFQYVKNIDVGLRLFLFNYSKRQLYGIYEASSCGQMNINSQGWTRDGSERTSFPAQVQIRTFKTCRPLLENQFSPIIEGNYYTQNHFQFELDHGQVSKLVALFSTQLLVPPPLPIKNTKNRKISNPRQPILLNGHSDAVVSSDALATYNARNASNEHLTVTNPSTCHEERQQCRSDDMEVTGKNETELISEKLQKLTVNFEPLDSISEAHVLESPNTNMMDFEAGGSREKQIYEEDNAKDSSVLPADYPSIVAELMLEVRELKAFRKESVEKMSQLEQKLRILESLHPSQGSDDRVLGDAEMHVSKEVSCSDQQLDSDDCIFLAGGYDEKSWLASLESYNPSKDIIKSLCPMRSVRCYASLAKLNGDIYVMGGGPGKDENLWYDTVECYSPVNNDWRSLACLKDKKGCLAALTLHGKIFAMGGGNGVNCYSDLEMLEPDLGRWIPGRSMLEKRFALAAVELNGAIYAVGGFDGEDYSSSTERFDPRELSWSRLGSMNSKRGCHALVVLNEKLYAVGGFDGQAMVSTVEVYDPRVEKWAVEASMNFERGYCTAAVLNNSIYAIGGLDENQNIVEKVERYEEGCGWQVTDLKAIGKRCFASAIV